MISASLSFSLIPLFSHLLKLSLALFFLLRATSLFLLLCAALLFLLLLLLLPIVIVLLLRRLLLLLCSVDRRWLTSSICTTIGRARATTYRRCTTPTTGSLVNRRFVLNCVSNSLETRYILVISWFWLWQVALVLLLLLLRTSLSALGLCRSWRVVISRCWGCWRCLGCVINILTMQDSVTKFLRNDWCRKIRLDSVLDDTQLEYGVDCWASWGCHLEAVSDKFANTSRKIRWYWCIGTSYDLHRKHVETWRVKRRPKCAHFIQHHSHAPDISTESIRLRLNDLRGKIVRCSNACTCFLEGLSKNLSDT